MQWGRPEFKSCFYILNGVASRDDDWRIEEAGRRPSIEKAQKALKDLVDIP